MEHQDRLSGVVEFVRTVQAGGFTAAGLGLGLTGSAVGKSVSRLEARLGTKLLHRTTRRISLTKEGEAYFESCLRLLDELGEIEQVLATGREEAVGRVRLDLPGAFGRRHILPVLHNLVLQHPRLDLSVMFSERTADIIGESIDLAVRIGQLPDDSELMATRLGRQTLVICASPAYLAEHGAPADPDDLRTRDCIVGWRGNRRRTWLLRDPVKGEVRQGINVRHELSDGEAMVSAVLAGCGLCQLPTWLISDRLETGDLVPVLQQFAGAEMPIHAVWPRTRYTRPRVRVILDALQKAAGEAKSAFHA